MSAALWCIIQSVLLYVRFICWRLRGWSWSWLTPNVPHQRKAYEQPDPVRPSVCQWNLLHMTDMQSHATSPNATEARHWLLSIIPKPWHDYRPVYSRPNYPGPLQKYTMPTASRATSHVASLKSNKLPECFMFCSPHALNVPSCFSLTHFGAFSLYFTSSFSFFYKSISALSYYALVVRCSFTLSITLSHSSTVCCSIISGSRFAASALCLGWALASKFVVSICDWRAKLKHHILYINSIINWLNI